MAGEDGMLSVLTSNSEDPERKSNAMTPVVFACDEQKALPIENMADDPSSLKEKPAMSSSGNGQVPPFWPPDGIS